MSIDTPHTSPTGPLWAGMGIALHLPSGAGRLTADQTDAVTQGFLEAVSLAAPLLELANVDVMGMDSPDQTIPSWGCGGFTYSAHTVVLALDPDNQALSLERVRATLVHEFHHIAREHGPGCGTSLRERIVSEGLAMLFEEQVLGRASEFAHVDIDDHDIDRAITQLDQDPADEGLWFFHSGDVPLWFGYTLGYRWAKAYSQRTGLSASDLVDVPAADISSAVAASTCGCGHRSR